MPTFKATSPEGIVTEYDATLPDPEHLQPGWRLEQIIIAEASPDAPEPVPTGKVMTKLEYLRRFTQDERITIRTVAAAAASRAPLQACPKSIWRQYEQNLSRRRRHANHPGLRQRHQHRHRAQDQGAQAIWCVG
jgi:hypothetical protein